MSSKTPVSFGNERLVEPLLCNPSFVTGDKEDAHSIRIECKRDTPYSISRIEPKLLHIGMLRPIERVDMRPPQKRTDFLQNQRCRDQRVLDHLRQRRQFWLEIVVTNN
jgi:hypothetical protein